MSRECIEMFSKKYKNEQLLSSKENHIISEYLIKIFIYLLINYNLKLKQDKKKLY